MFAFLRRHARPRWHPPLRELRWDGTRLALQAQPGTPALALELDGCHFDELACDALGRAQLEFEFAVNGAAGVS
ncbi:MAG: hypothetical protein F9K31_10280, partial [Dokdonella sp.]